MARLPRLSRAQSLVSQTEQVLREAIRSGRFGTRLPTAVELAEQLGVSRETVRQAEAALERDGLLVKYRRKGTLLRPPPMALRKRSARVLGYLQADYATPGGAPEGVMGAPAALMLQGALREAGRAGFPLAVRHAAPDDMDRALREIQESAPLRGVIFASFGEEKLVRQALGLHVPVILLDHDLHLPRIGTVREDSAQAARLAVAHLAALGHRRIAYAPWRRDDLNPWRLTGYRDGLRIAGLPRRRAWELPVEITPQGASGLAGRLLALRPAPTALLCYNNTLARMLMEALTRGGVRVPRDLSVMGLGGEEVRGLACVQTDWPMLGRKAVQVLLRAREGRRPEHHLVAYTLRKGDSVAPALRGR